MKHSLHIGLLLLPFIVGCSGKPAKESAVSAPSGVGIRSFLFKDSARKREIVTKVWYPTTVKEGYKPAIIFDTGAVENAPMPKEKHPTVFLSHGTGGYAETMSWIATTLASQGFVVIAPNHPGDTFGNVSLVGRFRKWERPRDISFLIDHLSTVPDLAAAVDKGRLGVAGFSMGGYAALALAGIEFNRATYENYCKANKTVDCKLFEGVDRRKLDTKGEAPILKDDRIKATVALAPFGGPGSGAGKVSGPVFLIAAEDDEILPYSRNAKHFSELVPNSKLVTFPQGKHYALLGPCTAKGIMVVPEICSDPAGVDRNKVQEKISPEILNFFKQSL